MTVSDGAWGIRQKIIDDFNVKIRNYVRDQTVDRTANVWYFNKAAFNGRQVWEAVAEATNNSGETALTNTISGPTTMDLSSGPIDGAAINTMIRTWMQTYSYHHKVTIQNIGGFGDFDSVNLVIRLSTPQGGAMTAVNNAVNSAITTAGLATGTVATAEAVNKLIDDCQAIWKQQCRDTSRKTYLFNYCHANHSSHANHGSRGRR